MFIKSSWVEPPTPAYFSVSPLRFHVMICPHWRTHMRLEQSCMFLVGSGRGRCSKVAGGDGVRRGRDTEGKEEQLLPCLYNLFIVVTVRTHDFTVWFGVKPVFALDTCCNSPPKFWLIAAVLSKIIPWDRNYTRKWRMDKVWRNINQCGSGIVNFSTSQIIID